MDHFDATPKPLAAGFKRTPLNRIQALRNVRGWSREKLAGEVGVTINTIGRWERDDGYLAMTLAYVLKLADVFGLPPVAILPVLGGWTLDTNPNPDGDR